MTIKEVRDVLYCHLMDLEAEHPNTWDQDIWEIKEALRETVNHFDSLMAYFRNPSAK